MRKLALASMLFLATITLPLAQNQSAAQSVTASAVEPFGGRKTVTVYADSEAEASSRAQSENPGWTVIGIKKVNPKDPISRMYTVTLQK